MFFRYRRSQLYAEDVSVAELAERFGTPLYVYSKTAFVQNTQAFEKAFHRFPHLVCFALKSNSNGALLKMAAGIGMGADIVSGGELYRARRAGFPGSRIVFAGVGKTDAEMIAALRSGILMFNVESMEELRVLNLMAARNGKQARIAFRVNPDIDPQTHPYISTGQSENKFGIPIGEAFDFYLVALTLRHIRVSGIHMHLGSQIMGVEPYRQAVECALELIDRLDSAGIKIEYVNLGGGFGIDITGQAELSPLALAKTILPLLRHRKLTLILEPGRSIVANAGALVTRVLFTKRNGEREFIIVDAGMNDLIRPSLYDAHHPILPVRKKTGASIVADIVGPVCETGDFLARDREIQVCNRGDLLTVMQAGAYGYAMSSNYNSRLRVAEVLVEGRNARLIGRRETYRDLIRREL